MAKDHSLRGASTYDPDGCEGGESCPMSSERTEEKPSQAVAVCGESRTHGDTGGDGKTPFGWASRPYPLKSWSQLFEVILMLLSLVHRKRRSQSDSTVDPAAIRGLATT
jgi:hypothetical protein